MINYSVIIPHKNIPALLSRCLGSIPRRTDIQIIVVDDNSDPSIVDFEHFPGLNEPGVEVAFSKKKEGAGSGYARNLGMERAVGRWILFADADDFFCQDILEELDRYKDSDTEVVAFKIKAVDSDTLKPVNRGESINQAIDAFFKGAFPESMLLLQHTAPWAKMVSRTFLLNNKIFSETTLYSNDVLWYTKVAIYAKKIIISGFALYTLTRRQGSLVTVWNKEALAIRYKVDYTTNLCAHTMGRIDCERFMQSHLDAALKISYGTFFRLFLRMCKDHTLRSGKAFAMARYQISKQWHYKYPVLYALSLLFYLKPAAQHLKRLFTNDVKPIQR